MPTPMLQARFHARIEEIDRDAWDALGGNVNPFVQHAFLAGLERHDCIRAAYGWRAHHLSLHDGERLVAVAPVYLKGNSHGEYVFDWSWASAHARHGLDYYPKLLCGVPYSPVTGPRLLVGSGPGAADRRSALIAALADETRRLGLSSIHVNFTDATDTAALTVSNGWLARSDWQFHWHNRGYRDFADFLDALSHRKRKNIRQERLHVARAGATCELRHGDELNDADWRALHGFYLRTFEEHGNHPALALDFFRHLGRTMPRQVLAVLCRRDGDLIAGALLMRNDSTLYGRYWGANETVPGLHFEACYYQGIEYCLREGLQRFEPGAQGEHKLARGFLPARTHSFHWIADTRFRAAIADALAAEAPMLDAYREQLVHHSPYTHR
ncbi:MAG: GNAT family N-acetyltransferase [Rhodanobacteraceae bacterium]